MGLVLRIIFGGLGFVLLGLFVWGVRGAPPKGQPYPIAKRFISVEAVPEVVFDYVVDLENLQKYVPGLVTIKSDRDEEEEVDVGTSVRADIVVPLLGRSDDVPITIVDLRRPGYLRFKMDLPPLMPIYTMAFVEGKKGGTEIEWVVDSRNHDGWFGELVLPMTRLIWQHREDEMLERFGEAFVRRQPDQEPIEESVADLVQ